MNYFSLFEIPVSLHIDKISLRKKYLELSRKFHPDRFATDEALAQQDALELSAQLNRALKVLGNQDETIKYVLGLKGLLQEEEKYNLSSDFLMQMMDINEELAEIQPGDENKKKLLHEKLKEVEGELYEPVEKIIENYREDLTTEKELLQVKDYYFRKKYLQRLYRQLDGML